MCIYIKWKPQTHIIASKRIYQQVQHPRFQPQGSSSWEFLIDAFGQKDPWADRWICKPIKWASMVSIKQETRRQRWPSCWNWEVELNWKHRIQ